MATTRRRKRKKRGRRRIRREVLCALFLEAGPLAQVHFFFVCFTKYVPQYSVYFQKPESHFDGRMGCS
jgi:hypothetical protein